MADLLDKAFHVMRHQCPVEYVFKAYLLKRLLFGRHSPRTTACYFEFPVGNARADMLLVNGDATVFEVKSRFDNPVRLESQLQEYYKCFTQVTVVTEAGYEDKYMDELPAHVGVATLTSRDSLSTKRTPLPHRDELDHFSLFQVFHQAERHRVAEELLGIRASAFNPAKRYHRLLERFAADLPVLRGHEEVVSALRQRQRTERLADRCKQLPRSLHVAGFSYRLHQWEWEALKATLNLPLCHP